MPGLTHCAASAGFSLDGAQQDHFAVEDRRLAGQELGSQRAAQYLVLQS
jgi:hypothetical protein